jgi:putative endonuclease
MIQSKQLGKIGEDLATEHLIRQGYKVLHRNYSTSLGEIDLVAYKNREYIFLEVKTRSSLSFGEPYLAVSERKKQKYRHLAMIYIQRECGQEPAYRFDIISVLINRQNGQLVQLDHFDNAFV